VKEVRYNDRPVENRVFTASEGGRLEIVIDDKAASLSGTVTDADQPTSGVVVAVTWPLPPAGLLSGAYPTAPTRDGRFNLTGLAPGDYRVFALPGRESDRLADPAILDRFLSRGETVHLDPSESRTLALKLLQ
jgi:hypothetical protein